jgi:anti-sigma-K factor RskA
MHGMTRDDDLDRLAAEHVLGLLDGEECARADRLLATDAVFVQAVARWRERLAELDETATPRPPAEALWRRIENNLAPAQPVRASDPTPVVVPDPFSAFKALWRNLAFWRVAGLASAAAALLLAIGLATVATQRPRTPVLVAVLLSEGTSRPAAVVNAFADGRAELIPLEAINVPPDRALEIWTLWDRAVGPRSIGLINEARTLRLNLENLPKPAPNQLFEITLEPKTGSPTGRPTGPILMKGTTSTAL